MHGGEKKKKKQKMHDASLIFFSLAFIHSHSHSCSGDERCHLFQLFSAAKEFRRHQGCSWPHVLPLRTQEGAKLPNVFCCLVFLVTAASWCWRQLDLLVHVSMV